MAADIALFPVLTEELMDRVRFQPGKYEFYYTKNDEEYSLQDEAAEGSNVYKIIDQKGLWNPEDYNLCLRRRYTIRMHECLFGEDGIAGKNSVLGIAVMWTSSDSKQRGIIPIGEIRLDLEEIEAFCDYEFKPAILRGEVELTTVLYLKKAGALSEKEEHLANMEGYLLGELDNISIRLDGTGSMFPIFEVEEPGMPLWNVKCEWEDPAYDSFAECVSITINRSHKNYKYLDREKRTFDDQLLKEVISSAIMIILTKLKEEDRDWYTLITSEDLQKGSVAQAIQYFTSALEWQVNNAPEVLSLSIRKFLDERMQ